LVDDAARSDYAWLAEVNPDRDGELPGSETNCVLTAIAVDMSLSSGETMTWQAPAEDLLPVTYLVNYQRDQLGLADNQSRLFRTGLGGVRAVMAAAPPHARAILLGPGKGSARFHAFNVVHDPRHGVLFPDGQAGGLVESPQTSIFVPLTAEIGDPEGAKVDPRDLTDDQAGVSATTGSTGEPGSAMVGAEGWDTGLLPDVYTFEFDPSQEMPRQTVEAAQRFGRDVARSAVARGLLGLPLPWLGYALYESGARVEGDDYRLIAFLLHLRLAFAQAVPVQLRLMATAGLLRPTADEIINAVRFVPAGDLIDPAGDPGRSQMRLRLANVSTPQWMETGRYPLGLLAEQWASGPRNQVRFREVLSSFQTGFDRLPVRLRSFDGGGPAGGVVAAYDVARFRREGAQGAVAAPDFLLFILSLHLDPGDGVDATTVETLRRITEEAAAQVNGRFLLPGHAQFALALLFTEPGDGVWRVEVPSDSDPASGSEPSVWPATLLREPGRVRAELLARLLRMLGVSEVGPDELVDGEIPQSDLLRIWALQELHEVPVNSYTVADPSEDWDRELEPAADPVTGNGLGAARPTEPVGLLPPSHDSAGGPTAPPPAQADIWWEGAMAAVMLRRWLRVAPGDRNVQMLDDEEHFRLHVAAVRAFMDWGQLRPYVGKAYTLVPSEAVRRFAQALTDPEPSKRPGVLARSEPFAAIPDGHRQVVFELTRGVDASVLAPRTVLFVPQFVTLGNGHDVGKDYHLWQMYADPEWVSRYLVPPAGSLSVGQVAMLRLLGRYDAPTRTRDALFTSVILAAQSEPIQTDEISKLAGMTPTGLRTWLTSLLDHSDHQTRQQVAQDRQVYDNFRRLLHTPHTAVRSDLFEAFFRVAPELLRIRLRVIMPDGHVQTDEQTAGPRDAPMLVLARTRTNHYMPALRHSAVAAYLAMHWLTTDISRPVPTTDSLVPKGQDQAVELARLPVADQASSVRDTLRRHRPYLTIGQHTNTLPPDLEPGTRIWLATQEGRTWAAWLASDRRYHRFDPHNGTVDQLDEAGFATWLGGLPDRPLTMVVARPTVGLPVSALDLRRAVAAMTSDGEAAGFGTATQTVADQVTMVQRFARMLYPPRWRGCSTVDAGLHDGGVRGDERRLIRSPGWEKVENGRRLERAVEDVSGTAFVLLFQDGRQGQALAVRATTDGLRWFDPQQPPQDWISKTRPAAVLEADSAWAVVLNAAGQIVRPDVAPKPLAPPGYRVFLTSSSDQPQHPELIYVTQVGWHLPSADQVSPRPGVATIVVAASPNLAPVALAGALAHVLTRVYRRAAAVPPLLVLVAGAHGDNPVLRLLADRLPVQAKVMGPLGDWAVGSDGAVLATHAASGFARFTADLTADRDPEVVQGYAVAAPGATAWRAAPRGTPAQRLADWVRSIVDTTAGESPVERMTQLHNAFYGGDVRADSVARYAVVTGAAWTPVQLSDVAWHVIQHGPGSTAFVYWPDASGRSLRISALRNEEGGIYRIELSDATVTPVRTADHGDVRVVLYDPAGRPQRPSTLLDAPRRAEVADGRPRPQPHPP